MSKEEARKRLADLEKDAKHTTQTEETDKQTKTDDINDPKFHSVGNVLDEGWKQDKDGTWYDETEKEGGE